MPAVWRGHDVARRRGRIIRVGLRAKAGMADLSAMQAKRDLRCEARDEDIAPLAFASGERGHTLRIAVHGSGKRRTGVSLNAPSLAFAAGLRSGRFSIVRVMVRRDKGAVAVVRPRPDSPRTTQLQ
jgi:hypothetical protein